MFINSPWRENPFKFEIGDQIVNKWHHNAFSFYHYTVTIALVSERPINPEEMWGVCIIPLKKHSRRIRRQIDGCIIKRQIILKFLLPLIFFIGKLRPKCSIILSLISHNSTHFWTMGNTRVFRNKGRGGRGGR